MKKNIFHNVSLYEIIFSDNGNTLTLSFTDTIEGNYFGYIKCQTALAVAEAAGTVWRGKKVELNPAK
ncbi:hypothetical protein QWX13_11050, partial [Neisseria gonorrhoeae]